MTNICPHRHFVVLYQDSYLMQLTTVTPLRSFLLPLSWDVTNYCMQNMVFKRTSDPCCQPNLASRESSLQSLALLLSPTNIRAAFSPLLNILQMNWPRKHACIPIIYLPSKHKYVYRCIFCGFQCFVFKKCCLYFFLISLPAQDHFSIPVCI